MQGRVARTRDGEQLRFTVEGAGPPMLLFHGLVTSREHWPFFIEHYAEHFSVVDWDYRGHGGQAPPRDLDTIGVEPFADDAHAVLAATARGPVVSAAISFGVQVALEHYRRHPNEVRALVLICGTDGHPLNRVSNTPRVRQFAAALFRALGAGGRLASLALSAGRLRLTRELTFLTGGAHRELCPPAVLDAVFAHVAQMDPQVVGREVAAYFEHSAADVLPTIRVPTLVIAGDKDELTPVATAERMCAAIPGARLVVFRGNGHLVQVERPRDVHAAIDQFLVENRL